jgi:hypothetical protein
MKYSIIILFLVVLFSCTKKELKNLNGTHWGTNYIPENKGENFPYSLSFKEDSLILTDGNNFKHKVKYEINNNSIEMFFKKNKKKVYFKRHSDSITFDSENYYWSNEISPNNKPYNLINYHSKEIFSYEYSSIIHLVKVKNEPKVILNDRTVNLDKIPSFLSGCNNGKPEPPVTLFIGKGITFNEFIETYIWIKVSGINKAILVTKNESFERFYSIKDDINISESLMNSFFTKKNIPPPPNYPLTKGNERRIIKIDNKIGLEQLPNKNDSIKYLLKISNKINLIEYLKLTEKIKNNENTVKEITAYNNG